MNSGIEWSARKELWRQRRLFAFTSLLALLCAILFTLFAPKEYATINKMVYDLEDDESHYYFKNALRAIYDSPQFGQKIKEQTSSLEENAARSEYKIEIVGDIVAVQVNASSPDISKSLCDSICLTLEDFVKRYQIEALSDNVRNAEMLEKSSLDAYETALKEYSKYYDAHSNSRIQSEREEIERLDNEVEVAQTVYKQASAKVLDAKLTLSSRIPELVELSSTGVPYNPVYPNFIVAFIVSLYLAWLFTAWWVLYKKRKDEQ